MVFKSDYDPVVALRNWDCVGTMDIPELPESPPKEHKAKFLYHLNTACRSCHMCDLGFMEAERAVANTVIARDPHCFSNMRSTSRFMIIGQNPGWDELAAGEPFVGQAGQNFNQELGRWGLSRDDFYITNAVKCFSAGNAKPERRQQDRCAPFLHMEINTIKPLLAATLGASAFELICAEHNFSSAIQAGDLVRSARFGVTVYPIYHPSPRNMISNREAFQGQMRKFCKLVLAIKKRHNLV